MKTKILIFLPAVCAMIGLCFCNVDAQEPQITAKDAVYTEAQSNRGADLIREIGCANCHGNTLEGGPGEVPSLVGNEFVNEWLNQSAYDLYIKVTSMPPDYTDRRTPQQDVDIMTLLLAINGYPAGNNELSSDPEVLKRIKIVLP
jgi:mono/diheme cytochrome c family protein